MQIAKNDCHTCNLKRTRLVCLVDGLCAALSVGCTIWAACRYGSLPGAVLDMALAELKR